MTGLKSEVIVLKPNFERLAETVTVPRTDPIYNCHGYLTKVPIAAIEPFIETFTQVGDIVADFFAGSGMTGLAALRLGRKPWLSDISVLGHHIAEGYSTRIKAESFKAAAQKVIGDARTAIGDLYATRRSTDNVTVEMVRTVWSFTYKCPSCEYRLVYFEHLSPKGKAPKKCPACLAPFVRRRWSRDLDVPVEVVVRTPQGRLIQQQISDFDYAMIKKAASNPRQAEIPSLKITEDREMFSRSGLGKAGLVNTRDFFSPRNAIALLELWRAINGVKDYHARQKLLFAFTAILPRASRRYQWSAQRPLNAQNQTYYISPIYYEWNVFELFGRKVNAAIRSDLELFYREPLLRSQEHALHYIVASADRLNHLETASVDYVFTDPPFGSNIFYSDMSLFHEAWLGKVTDPTSEAVVHTTGKRKNGSSERYECLLRSAFAEAYRILKPGRYMSVVFGNSSGRIWGLVQRAMRDAGFKAPAHVSILDKGQRSVKGLNSGSESVVTVDLILTVQKPIQVDKQESSHELRKGDTEAMIAQTINELSGTVTNASHVYARILRKAIQNHYALDQLHLTDVLLALRKNGYTIHPKTGILSVSKSLD
ncbi:DNA methyltransferase [Nitrospira sp. ND1]|uniref:DNA methyltransferase n=1 Tax=Nitrospira sp. ND1 TaxID=1658518 RepID=UPI001F45FB60|nr:DNA methyltransferase [Nitrospira sp. ND1]